LAHCATNDQKPIIPSQAAILRAISCGLTFEPIKAGTIATERMQAIHVTPNMERTRTSQRERGSLPDVKNSSLLTSAKTALIRPLEAHFDVSMFKARIG